MAAINSKFGPCYYSIGDYPMQAYEVLKKNFELVFEVAQEAVKEKLDSCSPDMTLEYVSWLQLRMKIQEEYPKEFRQCYHKCKNYEDGVKRMSAVLWKIKEAFETRCTKFDFPDEVEEIIVLYKPKNMIDKIKIFFKHGKN